MTAAWLPPAMSVDERDEHIAAATDENGNTEWHLAAALAWESWAAQVADGGFGVASVSTGAQSVTYRDGSGAVGDALARARYHRTRCRIKSVPVAPEYEAVGSWETPRGWRPLGTGRV